jgi:hypothetical protein
MNNLIRASNCCFTQFGIKHDYLQQLQVALILKLF